MKFRKPLILTFLVFSLIPVFGADIKTAEGRIESIESIKAALFASKNGEPFTREENDTIRQMYKVLEGEDYTVSSINDELKFRISPYDIESATWKINISGDYFGGLLKFEREFEIPYSVILEKRFIHPANMTEHQRDDYEYYVNEYENRFIAGETIIYAEVTFRITHWEEASQYRILPREIRLYKLAKHSRLIDSRDGKSEPEYIVHNPPIEYRTERQIKFDSNRIKRILKNEEKENTEEVKENSSDDKFLDQSGRRCAIITLDYEMEDFNFGDLKFSSMELDNAEGRLIWGIGKFFFGELEFGIDLDSVKEEPIYSFGLAGGANYTFNGVFRPFVDVGIRGRSDNKAVAKFGGGMDFLLGHFQITLGYNYNIASSESYVRTLTSEEKLFLPKKFSTYYLGIGLNW